MNAEYFLNLIYLCLLALIKSMKISEDVLFKLFEAIKAVGENGVLDMFDMATNRCGKIIDEIADVICLEADLNKKMLFIKGIRDPKKKKAVTVLIHILKRNEVSTSEIIKYFNGQELRVKEIYNSSLDLSDKFPFDREIKTLIDSVYDNSIDIFKKYYYNPNKN